VADGRARRIADISLPSLGAIVGLRGIWGVGHGAGLVRVACVGVALGRHRISSPSGMIPQPQLDERPGPRQALELRREGGSLPLSHHGA